MKRNITAFFLFLALTAFAVPGGTGFTFVNSGTALLHADGLQFFWTASITRDSDSSYHYTTSGTTTASGTQLPGNTFSGTSRFNDSSDTDFHATVTYSILYVPTGVYVGSESGSFTDEYGTVNVSADPITPPPCFTNITFDAVNNSVAWRIYAVSDDGTGFVGQQMIPPKGSYHYQLTDVPCDQADNYSLWASDPAAGDDALVSTGLKGRGDGGTNNVSGTLPPMGQPTNNILWTPSTETNTEAVVKAVKDTGSVLYDAAAKTIVENHNNSTSEKASVDAVKSSVDSAKTQAHTDATAVSSAVNSAATTVSTHVDSAASQAHSDQATSQGLLTQIRDNTSQAHLTNYAQESTLTGISNLMTHLATNAVGQTYSNTSPSDMASAAAAGAASGSNTLVGLFSGATVPSTGASYGNSSAFFWTIHIPYAGGFDLDMNPFDQTWVQNVATWLRTCLKWVISISLFYRCSKAVSAAIGRLGAARQATSASAVPLAGTVSAMAMAGLITVAMLVVPLVVLSWLTGSEAWSSLQINPFGWDVQGWVSVSIWMADQFFPLALIVYCAIQAMIFETVLAGCIWGVQTLTRFFVG